MSLKAILNKTIQERGYISYDEMVAICRAENKKPSNGERRLRKSDSPMIEAVMSENGKYIKGYKVVENPEEKRKEALPLKVEPSLFP